SSAVSARACRRRARSAPSAAPPTATAAPARCSSSAVEVGSRRATALSFAPLTAPTAKAPCCGARGAAVAGWSSCVRKANSARAGTGKATSIVETVRQLVARDPSVRILMTSHANTAVDNAQERLQGLDSLRMVRIAEPEKVDPKFRASIVEADDPRVRNAHVVFGTVNRIALACKEAEMFDWLILDEANKVRFTETLPLLRLAPRWLLVGDHRQLPPVLDESAAAFPVDDDEAKSMVRDASFFELSWAVVPETNLVMLDEQYRMAAPIGSYVSVASYDGRLRNSPEMAALRSPLPWPFNRNLTWLTIRGRVKKGGSGSISNRAEIEAVGRVVRHLQRLGLEQLRVAVIAMYQDQVTQLRRELRMVALPGLAVDTVDAFEGEEADVVILSLVRSNEAERIGF